eukprot:9071852-Lingulodinium_polyedra.AAC.1
MQSRVRFSQRWAADANANKRHFIRTVAPELPVLYDDVAALAVGRGMRRVPVRRPPQRAVGVVDVGLLLAGFPCQDASMLNLRAKSMANR